MPFAASWSLAIGARLPESLKRFDCRNNRATSPKGMRAESIRTTMSSKYEAPIGERNRKIIALKIVADVKYTTVWRVPSTMSNSPHITSSIALPAPVRIAPTTYTPKATWRDANKVGSITSRVPTAVITPADVTRVALRPSTPLFRLTKNRASRVQTIAASEMFHSHSNPLSAPYSEAAE